MSAIMIVAAVLPALFLWLYTCRKDTQKEPMSQMVKALLYGMGIVVPVILIEEFVSDLLFDGNDPTTILGTAVEAFFVAAIPEEFMKLLALYLILRKNSFFDEHYDGIVYAVCVSLGFATIENVSYIISDTDIWFGVAVTRALLAVPGHYAFAVLMGYYYSLWYFGGKSTKNCVCMLLVPVVAHGFYDTIALSAKVSPELGGLCFILLVYFCIRLHKFAHKKVMIQINKDLIQTAESAE